MPCLLATRRDTMRWSVPFSAAILTAILAFTWLLEPALPDTAVLIPAVLVAALTVWNDARRAEWGLSARAFAPGLLWSLTITTVLAAAILGAGAAVGTLHDRRDFLGNLAPLVVWGAAQQWVLQTVVLREAQRATTRRAGIVVAALLFGAVHLPNPFLTLVTIAAALVWCSLYDRWPNILPLALSHGLGTLALLYAFSPEITGRLRVGAAYLRL
jgi:membrane protease YdiL (CAAX protease family)